MENITLDFYYVWIMDYNGEINVLYEGIDKKKAENKFEFADLSDFDTNMQKYGGNVDLEKFTNTYKYIYDEDIEDYPIEDYYDDFDIYQLVQEGRDDMVLVKTKKIIGQNELDEEVKNEAKDILYEVYKLLSENENIIYKRQAGYKTRKSDYFLYRINDEETIEIRLSNHSFNPKNVFTNEDIILDEIYVINEDDISTKINQAKEKNKGIKDVSVNIESNDNGKPTIYVTKPKNRIAFLSIVIFGVENETSDRFDYDNERLNEVVYKEVEFDPIEDNLDADDIYGDILLYIDDLVNDYKKSQNKVVFKQGGKLKTYWYKGLFN